MNIFRTVVLILAAAAGAEAARIVMEPTITNFEHKTWTKGPRVTENDTIDVTFVVKTCPKMRAKFEEKFWAVSDPKSSEYKKYMSREEIRDMLHPLPDAKDESTGADFIVDFLVAKNFARKEDMSVTFTRDLVRIKSLNAKLAEALFDTELHRFAFGGDVKHEAIRAAKPYSLPEELADKVSLVDKLVRLPRLDPRPVESSTPALRAQVDPEFNTCDTSKCSGATTPAVIKTRYGFPAKDSFTPGNAMACAEFQFQGVIASDLANFASTCGVEHVVVDKTTGTGGSFKAGVEALLDVEYIEAAAAPIPLEVINSVSYSLFDWSEALNDAADPAWVQSVSYGNDEVQQTSAEYMFECNTQFMLNGARGLSVLFASGDQGVWGRSGHDMTGEFHPDFPAGSPYVTAVGGTQFLQTSVLGEETTWADGGGGFSNTFDIPSYQAAAVEAYLSSGVALPEANQFNATGRAYPDVSALAGTANGYCVAYKGTYGKVGGTSAACPVFAGAVALLNDELLARGGAPMGFLNPWIYTVAGPAGAFFDVTSGTNNANFGAGFTATAGWDPATGYGTPNYPAMLALVSNATATN